MKTVLVAKDGRVLWLSPPFEQKDGSPKLVVPAVDHPSIANEPGWYIGNGETKDEAVENAKGTDYIVNTSGGGK